MKNLHYIRSHYIKSYQCATISIPFVQRNEIEKQMQEMLKLNSGVIPPSTSVFSSPILLVKKKKKKMVVGDFVLIIGL